MFTIHTNRLRLCPFVLDDAAAFAAYRSDPEVARYQGWAAPYSRAAAAELIEPMLGRRRPEHPRPGQWNQVAIRLADDPTSLIGDCAFRLSEDGRQACIGFTLARAFQGNGYATEGVRAMLGELLGSLGLHRVTAECDVQNLACQHVLDRVGMRREAHHVQGSYFKGAWASEYVYAILRSEFLAAN